MPWALSTLTIFDYDHGGPNLCCLCKDEVVTECLGIVIQHDHTSTMIQHDPTFVRTWLVLVIASAFALVIWLLMLLNSFVHCPLRRIQMASRDQFDWIFSAWHLGQHEVRWHFQGIVT